MAHRVQEDHSPALSPISRAKPDPSLSSGLWIFECPVYGLSAFSASREEALSQPGEEFAFLYNSLIEEPDDTLTPDAAALSDRLRSDVQQAQAAKNDRTA